MCQVNNSNNLKIFTKIQNILSSFIFIMINLNNLPETRLNISLDIDMWERLLFLNEDSTIKYIDGVLNNVFNSKLT